MWGLQLRIDRLHRSQANAGTDRVDHTQQLLIRNFAQVFVPDRARMLQLHRCFPPFRPGLEPEYLGSHIPVLGGIEQKARHLGVGLGLSKIQLLTVMLAQRLRINPDNTVAIRPRMLQLRLRQVRRYRLQECHRRPRLRPGDAARDQVGGRAGPSGDALDLPFGCQFRKRRAGALKRGRQTRKGLPSQDCDIDVSGIDLDRET